MTSKATRPKVTAISGTGREVRPARPGVEADEVDVQTGRAILRASSSPRREARSPGSSAASGREAGPPARGRGPSPGGRRRCRRRRTARAPDRPRAARSMIRAPTKRKRTTIIAFESDARIFVSRGRSNTASARADSKMTAAYPMTSAEARKRPGKSGVCQSLWSLAPDQHERPERRLVHRGKEDSQGEDRNHRPVEGPGATRPGHPAERAGTFPAILPHLQERRGKLDPQDDDVRHDADRHFEEDRVPVPVPEQGDPPDVPVAPQVDENREPGERIAEGAREDRRAHEGMVLPLVEDVAEDSHREPPAREGRPGHHVVGDPYPPGEPVGERRSGAEAGEEAPAEDGEAQGEDREDTLKVRVRMGPPTACARGLIPPPLTFLARAAPGPVDRESEDGVEDDRGDESLVHGVLEGFGQLGHGFVAEVGQAEFPERDPGGGQAEDLGPSPVRLPVDLSGNTFSVPWRAALRVGPERFKTPEDHRFARTRRRRRRDPALCPAGGGTSRTSRSSGRRCSIRTSAR